MFFCYTYYRGDLIMSKIINVKDKTIFYSIEDICRDYFDEGIKEFWVDGCAIRSKKYFDNLEIKYNREDKKLRHALWFPIASLKSWTNLLTHKGQIFIEKDAKGETKPKDERYNEYRITFLKKYHGNIQTYKFIGVFKCFAEYVGADNLRTRVFERVDDKIEITRKR